MGQSQPGNIASAACCCSYLLLYIAAAYAEANVRAEQYTALLTLCPSTIACTACRNL